MFFRQDYADRVVASFTHQIQSEYYCGNIYVSIDFFLFEHIILPIHTETLGRTQACTSHSVFH